MQVEKIEEIAVAVKRFTLTRTDGAALLPFQPGAHVETLLPTANGLLKRHYSLCSPADETGYYQIAVKREEHSRGGSAHWHEEVGVGQALRISAPVNHFALSPVARRHVLIAGGIGITPFVPMMRSLQATGQSFALHAAAKSPAQAPFREWIEATFPGRAQYYFSSQGVRVDPGLLADQKVGTHVYLCGPQAMMKEFRDAARLLGYPQSHIHVEAFHADHAESDLPFQVWLRKSQREIAVAKDQSLLDALREADVPVPSACEAGGCGTCQVNVVEGEVEHRDFYLTEEEQQRNDVIIACVSRARGQRLVLDL